MQNNHKWLLGSFLLALFCLTIAGVTWMVYAHFPPKTKENLEFLTTPSPTPTPTPDPLRPRTALLLGYMGGNHDGGLLTDTILLAHANPRSQQLSLISIPRDLWVEIPKNFEASQSGKINSVFAIARDKKRYPNLPDPYTNETSGLLLTKDIIQQITGQNINYSFIVNQAGLLQALNKLAPLTINIPYTFTDHYYPIPGEETNQCEFSSEDVATMSATLKGFDLEKQFSCRYEELSFVAGNQVIEPAQAIKFVRSRHSTTNGGDFGRSQRQQALIEAIIKKLSSPNSWVKLPNLLTTLLDAVDTDSNISELSKLIPIINNPTDWSIQSLVLSNENVLIDSRSKDGQFILTVRPASPSSTKNNPTDMINNTSTSTTSAFYSDSKDTSDQTDIWLPIHLLINQFLENQLI